VTSMVTSYGNKGCRVFKWGIQNWKDFCLIINIPKEKYRILRIALEWGGVKNWTSF
jgi:hypothetical protein